MKKYIEPQTETIFRACVAADAFMAGSVNGDTGGGSGISDGGGGDPSGFAKGNFGDDEEWDDDAGLPAAATQTEALLLSLRNPWE